MIARPMPKTYQFRTTPTSAIVSERDQHGKEDGPGRWIGSPAGGTWPSVAWDWSVGHQ